MGTAQGQSKGPRQARRRAMGPTTAEGRYLREQWGKLSRQEMAARLHVDPVTIYRWAVKLELHQPKSRKRWEAHAIGALDGNIATSAIQSVARQVVRTITAVERKMDAERIAKSSRGYTAASLAAALGVDAHKVLGWVKLGWLPDRRRHTARTPEQRGDLHYISEADVWRLACEHPLDVFPRGLSAEQWVWLAGLAPCGTGHGRKSA